MNVGFFKSNAWRIINENDIEIVISDAGNELINRISEWISEGSGWVIKSVDKHEIDISKYKPLRGSSYLQLPEKLKNKKALINIQNENNNGCFRWCNLAYLFTYFQIKITHSGSQNIKKNIYINKVKYDKKKEEKTKVFPVKIKDIPKIENLNDDIRFNICGVTKDQTIYPLYTSNKICDKTCNLLLIENGNGNHYVWIKDFNKLMNSQS